MNYDLNKKFGLLKFHSGYGQFNLNSPKCYSLKLINAQTVIIYYMFIFLLFKGTDISSPFGANTSNVFVSRDYGKSFTSVRERLTLPYEQKYAVISQFVSNPVYNSHVSILLRHLYAFGDLYM